jgi:hypothetical protein
MLCAHHQYFQYCKEEFQLLASEKEINNAMNSKTIFGLIVIISIILITSLSDCDHNRASVHPCNFPDDETLTDLLSPWEYKIIDKASSVNLVDTVKNARIHIDSVILFDENFEVISPSYGYRIDNWVFSVCKKTTHLKKNQLYTLSNFGVLVVKNKCLVIFSGVKIVQSTFSSSFFGEPA